MVAKRRHKFAKFARRHIAVAIAVAVAVAVAIMTLALIAAAFMGSLYNCDDIPEEAQPSVKVGNEYVWRGTRVPYAVAHNVPNITVSWRDAKPAYYSVAMVDPDAPSAAAPKYREIRHWLVVNVAGADLIGGNLEASGETLSKFVNPSPPKGSGYHRYVQLVYGQIGKKTFAPVSPSIAKFNVSAWSAKEALSLVACNYFETEQE